MKPLTLEELHAIKKTATGNDAMSALVRRLCEAAERSIPRPISEAPRDGTKVLVKDPIYGWCEGMSFGDVWENEDGWKLLPTEFIPIPEQTDGTV